LSSPPPPRGIVKENALAFFRCRNGCLLKVGKVMRSRCFTQQLSVVLVVLIVAAVQLKNAVAATPYQAELSLAGIKDVKVNATSATLFDAMPTVRVSGKIPNLGHIDARFTTRRNKTWTSYIERDGRRFIDQVTPLLMRGKVAVGGGTVRSGRYIYRTGASIINNELKITFPGRATGSRKSRQRIYTVRMLLDGSIRVSARVSSVPSRAFHRGACGSAVGAAAMAEAADATGDDATILPIAEESPTPVDGASSGQPVMTKVVTISTDADPEWYAKYGENSNAVIASIINTAEAMYDKQLGLRFRIVRQHIYSQSSPYTSTDPGELLRLFTGNVANQGNLGSGSGSFNDEVDIKHLFTGKDMDGSVIGIAYIGTVCASPGLAYGITQSYVEAASPGIFAHELGHNFGAFHDVSDRKGIMYPSISIPPAERFSDFSLSEISAHLSRNSGCISRELMNPRDDTPGSPTPAPTPEIPNDTSPAFISLTRRSAGGRYSSVTRLAGRVTSAAGGVVGAVRLNLMARGVTVGSVVTDDQGRYEFLVNFSLPRGKMIYVYVETADESISSRFMWIGDSYGRARR